MKLRLKILLLLIPPIIAPLFVMGWVAYSELSQVSQEKSFARMVDSIKHLQAFADADVQTAKSNIELFARHIMVKKYVLTPDEGERYTLMQGPLLRAFSSFQEAFPRYYEVRILLPDGYEDIRLTNRDVMNHTEEEADSPEFRALVAAGDSVYSAIYRNPDNGETALFVGKPLILRDASTDAVGTPPSLRGYLAITVDLGELASRISSASIGRSGYLLATDDQGEPLFQVGRDAKQKVVQPALMQRALSSAAAGRPQLAELYEESTFVLGRKLLPDFNVFAVEPEADLRKITRDLALVVAALTLLTIIVTTATLFLALQHYIIRPVQLLQGMSKEIGCGRLTVINSLRSNDEIGELAHALVDMAGNLQRSDERIRYIAYHDSLTGLPNRAMFGEYLNQVIADSKRHAKQFALLYLDIDDFKRVNDTLGHQSGDRLLQEVTERLSACLRQSDYVARVGPSAEAGELLARLGGDEFVILLPEINGPHAPSSLARRLLSALAEPVSVNDHDFYISASVGITVFPTDGDNAETLAKNADIAMYHAKEQGKNDYQFYLESMNVLAHERLALENKLRRALDNSELSLYYQPQVDADSGRIVGLEALIRWRHPEDGNIPPDLFIPVAEETGLILEIGEWVIDEACRQMREWQRAGLPVPAVSINVSGHQFGKQNVARLIHEALVRNRLAPGSIEVEITESAIMEQPDRAVRELAAIKDLGVGIALDDFGTGYSSFSYLHRFPIDTLKIDRSFIRDIAEKDASAELVAAIIAMAHILKLRVVAEGIENREQLAILAGKGCDVLQGYLFKAPVPADQVPEMLHNRVLKIA